MDKERRDRLREIVTAKARRGGTRHAWAMINMVEELQAIVRSEGPRTVLSDLLPIRVVTILEVFIRGWIRQLIDHGQPFLDNGATLFSKTGLKIDYALSCALQGRTLSLGELLAHEVQLNSFEQVLSTLTTVVGADFKPRLSAAYDRCAVATEGAPPTPYLSDMEKLCRDLRALYDARHILTHELPSTPPCTQPELDSMIVSAIDFLRAADESLSALLDPNPAWTQAAMTEQAGSGLETAEAELEAVLKDLGHKYGGTYTSSAHELWLQFREAEAKARSGIDVPFPGSIAPMIYCVVKTELTRDRIKYLRAELKRQEGEF